METETASSQPLTLLLECSPSRHAWASQHWRVCGAVATESGAGSGQLALVRREGPVSTYRLNGLSLQLFKDECESYYYALQAPEPRIYVISRVDPDGVPQPFLVTASYDRANAFMETEERVDDVPMPPPVYRWVESFVLQNYVPERRRKRRRQDWKKGDRT
jgi:hypothetical protein